MFESPPSSILIIKLSAIGDVVHTLAALEVLRGNFPHSRIDWLVEEEALPIISGHKDLNHIYVCPRKRWVKSLIKNRKGVSNTLSEIRELLKDIRARRYDLVIDFQGLLKSGIFTWLVKGTRKVGMDGAREGARLFFTESPYVVNYEQHAIDRYLELCSALGCREIVWRGKIPVKESDIRRVEELLSVHGIRKHDFVVINPIARWQTKLWSIKSFSELGDLIIGELGLHVIFTGSNVDRPYVEAIAENMSLKAVNLAGLTTLKELAHLFHIATAAVSTDTGPMHIAAAMDCPVVALFGPTDPIRTGPYGSRHMVIRTQVDCSPCFKKHCSTRVCMREITPSETFSALAKLISQNKNRNMM